MKAKTIEVSFMNREGKIISTYHHVDEDEVDAKTMRKAFKVCLPSATWMFITVARRPEWAKALRGQKILGSYTVRTKDDECTFVVRPSKKQIA